MASVAAEKYISSEEYLTAERRAKIKSEYIYGEIFAMSGASNAHNLITLDIATELNIQLRGSGCLVYSNDMRVKRSRPVLISTLMSLLCVINPVLKIMFSTPS